MDNVVVTPHLGASTAEAQDKAGTTVAEMVRLAPNGEFVPYAVNVSAGAEVAEIARPFLPCATSSAGSSPAWPRARCARSSVSTWGGSPTPTRGSSRSRS